MQSYREDLVKRRSGCKSRDHIPAAPGFVEIQRISTYTFALRRSDVDPRRMLVAEFHARAAGPELLRAGDAQLRWHAHRSCLVVWPWI